MHDYDDTIIIIIIIIIIVIIIIIIIIHLKTEMIPIITGANRTTPQPSRTCMKDNAIYGKLN